MRGARVVQEEIFGPVCVVDTFSTEAEALKKANDTNFGLGAVVFTKDFGVAIRVSDALEAGTVNVNNTNYTDPAYPFGGWKGIYFPGFNLQYFRANCLLDSGVGRENGRYVLEEYTQLKSTIITYVPRFDFE